MHIETACSACGTHFRTKAEFVGRSIQCKSCGAAFVIAECTARPAGQAARPASYMDGFNAVQAELIARFGPDAGTVQCSPIPLYLDPKKGLAESLTFRNYVEGVAYCTCALSLYPQQKPAADGQYELMMCSRTPADFIPGVIGNLARYTFDAALKPGDTLDLGPSQPKGSTLRGLLCLEPEMSPKSFRLFGRDCTVRLLMGITKAEMESCQEYGSEGVALKLKRAGEFPFTSLTRKSVVE